MEEFKPDATSNRWPPGSGPPAGLRVPAGHDANRRARAVECPTVNTQGESGAKVWDLPVRVMHWLLLAAVCGSWASQEIEGIPFAVHLGCGYAVLLLVATRIVWGFVGTRHARFSDFVRGPRAVIGYARSLLGGSPRPFVGHNPLGALMVLLLLALLLAQAVTGLFTNDQVFDTGPLYGYVSGALSDRITTIHKQLFDLILVAIGLHVAAALFYLFAKRENLIRPMLTGRKSAALVPESERIVSSRVPLALVVLALLGLALWALVATAPEASLFMTF
jgi:cytochrome b